MNENTTVLEPPDSIDGTNIKDHTTEDLEDYYDEIDDLIDDGKPMGQQRASVWHVIMQQEIKDELEERK